MSTHILHRYVKPLSANPAKIRQQVHVVTAVIFCVRDSGVCGGGVVPALYPSSQPHQPGGDQRQAGVHEDRGAGSQGQCECAYWKRTQASNPAPSIWSRSGSIHTNADLIYVTFRTLSTSGHRECWPSRWPPQTTCWASPTWPGS